MAGGTTFVDMVHLFHLIEKTQFSFPITSDKGKLEKKN
jgi:hypothetical protein